MESLQDRIEKFISRAIEAHGELYSYKEVEYVNAHQKVKIICHDHGPFFQHPLSHVKGAGCPTCAGTGTKHTLDEVITAFKKIHGNAYSYDLVEYHNNSTPVTLVCGIHGEFKLTPNKHKSGRGCQKCSKVKSVKKMTVTKAGKVSPKKLGLEEFLRRATSIHGDKFDYKLVDVSAGIKSKVKIICPDHGEYVQTAEKHLSGRGCPHCKNSKQYSTTSTKWLDSLGIKSLIKEYRLPQNKLIPVDGYDPITNTIYQFHGDYWHGGEKFNPTEINKTLGLSFQQLKIATDYKDEKLRQWGYNLVVMWESEWIHLLNESTKTN